MTRAGHTEAGCDFTRLAGLSPAAVIVEILNDDGTMARRPDLIEFSKHHDIKIGTIADLIRYRVSNEQSIERINEQEVETEFGKFKLLTFEDHINRDVHFALVKGNITDQSNPLMHVIAAKAHAFNEALKPEFKIYQQAVVKNAQTMASRFQEHGYKIV